MAEEDLICCHLTTNPFYESDNEEFSVLDEISYEPVVETVDEEVTTKFVYKDAEEIFPTSDTSTEPKLTKDTEPDIQDVSPECEERHEHVKEMLHQEPNDADLIMRDDTSYKMCPDFPHGKE